MRHFIYDHKKHPMKSFATKKKDSHHAKNTFLHVLALLTAAVVFTAVFGLFLFAASIIKLPSNIVLYFLLKVLLFIFKAAGLITAFLLAAVASFPISNLRVYDAVDYTARNRENCTHLREFYGVNDDHVVTKCFDSAEKGLINKDLCIFVCGEELRICSNIVQGFKSESADVGCYALPIKEIKYETTVFNKISALRISDGDFYVTLGKRAGKIIEKANNDYEKN
ncbi:MAG: hypothetical protein IJN63_03365 [Clostridia bacterium]|nr:hypothetical protein [Clostridia bacterium]